MKNTHHDYSIGTSFLIHGTQGIDTHYKTDHLMLDAETRQLISSLRASGNPAGIRHRIGGMMIALGAAISGKTHDLQERQATMPSPTAKPGVVPTR